MRLVLLDLSLCGHLGEIAPPEITRRFHTHGLRPSKEVLAVTELDRPHRVHYRRWKWHLGVRAALLRIEVKIVFLESVDGEHTCVADSQPEYLRICTRASGWSLEQPSRRIFRHASRMHSISAGSNGGFWVSRILAGPRTSLAGSVSIQAFSRAKECPHSFEFLQRCAGAELP